MLPPAFNSSPSSYEAREFEELVQHGILAIRNGNRSLGRKLLNQAALTNSADARIWIWLSATTDDLQQRRSYLENAIAVDPLNAIVRRGLQMIDDELSQAQQLVTATEVLPQPSEVQPEQAASPPENEDQPLTLLPGIEDELSAPVPEIEPEGAAPAEASMVEEGEPPHGVAQEAGTIYIYTCPNCSTLISYGEHETVLVCQHCGFTRGVDEHVISRSFIRSQQDSPSSGAVRHWIENQGRLTCEHCGLTLLFPTGQPPESCPYCASTLLTASPELMDLEDPGLIMPFKIDSEQAASGIKAWLGKGVLAPDDLALRHAGMHLSPAFCPFWLLTGRLDIPWFVDVNIGSDSLAEWEARTGTHTEPISKLLIPALRKISMPDLADLGSFNLDDLVEFSPVAVDGAIVLARDHSLADASLLARERVSKKVRFSLTDEVDPRLPRRNFKTGSPKWGDLTSKLVLLPVYLGSYPFQGKRHRLFINGQTGSVSGKRPVDMLKMVMVIATGIILLIVMIALIWLFTSNPPG